MDNKKPVYAQLAMLIDAFHRCQKTNNPYAGNHEERINCIVKRYMPSGSGVDNGTKLSWSVSNKNKLVFTFGFHHMDEHGYYDGWTEHSAIVTPDLAWGFSLKITGINKNQIKDYLGDLFHDALSTPIDPYVEQSTTGKDTQ